MASKGFGNGGKGKGLYGAPEQRGYQRGVGSWLDIVKYGGVWVVSLVIIPLVGMYGRIWWGENWVRRSLVTLILGAVCGAMIYGLWKESAPRDNQFDRYRAVTSVAWIFFVILGTPWFGGPGGEGMARYGVTLNWSLIIWLGGGCMALWWTYGILPAVAGRGGDDHKRDSLAEQLGIGGVEATGSQVTANGVVRKIHLRLNGKTVDDVRKVLGNIASRINAPATGMRVHGDPEKSGEATVTVVYKDMLKRMGPWPGPLHPGLSIALPVRVAMREDGSDVLVNRMGKNLLISGMTGAGKTEGAVCSWLDEMTRDDVCSIWMDTAKDGQTVPDLAPSFAFVITDEEQARRLIKALQRAVKYRAGKVRGRSFKASRRMPQINIHIEEGNLLAEILGSGLRDFVATCRSVGMPVSFSIQRPAADILDTSTRSNFQDAWCFGVKKLADTTMILSESTIDEGAHPEAWGDHYPGYCYREQGESAEVWATPARTWEVPQADIHAHVATWAPRMARIDRGTLEAMGDIVRELITGPDYARSHGWDHTTDAAGNDVWTPTAALVETEYDPEEDEPDHSSEQGEHSEPVPAYGSPAPEQEEEEDFGDELSETEQAIMREELDKAVKEIATELQEQGLEVEELTEELIAPGEFSEMEFYTGTDSPVMTYEQRIAAAADAIQGVIRGRPSVKVETFRILEALAEQDGWDLKRRPALHRLLNMLERAGLATNNRYGWWTIEGSAPAWLREHVGWIEQNDDEEQEEVANAE